MSNTLNPTIATITADVNQYGPAVIQGVQAAELVPGATGVQKAAAVISAVSGSLATSSNVNLAAIAGLVNLTVSIFNALGVFTHKSAAAPTSTVTAHILGGDDLSGAEPSDPAHGPGKG